MARAQDPAGTPFVPADYHWLALRFAADRDSRDPGLLAQVTAAMAGRPRLRVLDLGAGSGANLLYLAPRLPVARQEWTLIDRDALLVSRVTGCFASFARHLPGMSAEPARVRFDDTVVDYRATSGDFLREDCPIYGEQYDLVVANAVFDLLSADQLDRFLGLAASRWPAPRPGLYFTINLDRGLSLQPGHAGDAAVFALFQGHMQREQAFGRAMGADSAREMLRLMNARGMHTQAAPSTWSAREPGFVHANLDFFESATREMIAMGHGPDQAGPETETETETGERAAGDPAAWLAPWLANRRQLADHGALTLEVAHQDIWASWPERGEHEVGGGPGEAPGA